MSKQGTDLDLLRQFQIYEAVLHHEDGEEKGTPLRQLDDTIRWEFPVNSYVTQEFSYGKCFSYKVCTFIQRSGTSCLLIWS